MRVQILALFYLNVILALGMSIGSILPTYLFRDTAIVISPQTKEKIAKRLHSSDIESLRADTTSLWEKFQRLNAARDSVDSFAIHLMWCFIFITAANAIWCVILLRKSAEQDAAANP